MSCNKFPSYLNNNNNFELSTNLFGQLKKSNVFKKQIDDNFKTINKLNGMLPVTRAKSFNNKILFNNNKNSFLLNGINNNKNINGYKKNNNNNGDKNNKNDNEHKNNADNNNTLSESHRMKMINSQNNKLYTFTTDKNQKNFISFRKY